MTDDCRTLKQMTEPLEICRERKRLDCPTSDRGHQWEQDRIIVSLEMIFLFYFKILEAKNPERGDWVVWLISPASFIVEEGARYHSGDDTALTEKFEYQKRRLPKHKL